MADITAYPIIFSAPMVRAILREIEAPGTGKRQTRRLARTSAKSYPGIECEHGYDACPRCDTPKPSVWQKRHDKFQAGERPWLYVTEKWQTADEYHNTAPRDIPDDDHRVQYDGPDGWVAWDLGGVPGRWRSSLHMPKWASRLSLRVTNMRMERLQDISEDDAQAEGIPFDGYKYFYGHPDKPIHKMAGAKNAFPDLWDYIHGAGAWAENPEVVVTEFEPHLQNIGSVT